MLNVILALQKIKKGALIIIVKVFNKNNWSHFNFIRSPCILAFAFAKEARE
jgi:hypothetical protein